MNYTLNCKALKSAWNGIGLLPGLGIFILGLRYSDPSDYKASLHCTGNLHCDLSTWPRIWHLPQGQEWRQSLSFRVTKALIQSDSRQAWFEQSKGVLKGQGSCRASLSGNTWHEQHLLPQVDSDPGPEWLRIYALKFIGSDCQLNI